MSAFNPNGCTNKGLISCLGDTPLHWPRFVTALCGECVPMLVLLWQPSSYMLYSVQAVLAKDSHTYRTNVQALILTLQYIVQSISRY